MNSQQYQMMRVIQKIRAFKGFEIEEVLQLLRICRTGMYRPGDVIYRKGESSDEMLILLKGGVQVVGSEGEILAELGPGTSTGEMGLFTGHPRSANIVAAQPSACLLLRKAELSSLLSHFPDMHLKLVYNIIALLSERLGDANRLNAELTSRLHQYEGEPEDDDFEEDGEEHEENGDLDEEESGDSAEDDEFEDDEFEDEDEEDFH